MKTESYQKDYFENHQNNIKNTIIQLLRGNLLNWTIYIFISHTFFNVIVLVFHEEST